MFIGGWRVDAPTLHSRSLLRSNTVSLKIIGAGFGRTGTLSLKQALETLGFTKCYHMAELTPAQIPLWRAAWRGEPVWDDLFNGYQAAVDWPTSAFWPQLMRAYPDAKVLLTVRDAKSWYRSASSTIFQRMADLSRLEDPATRERALMVHEIIRDGTFGGDLTDEANAIRVYEDNIARCKREVPAERLLVFEAKQGWSGLCAALGVPEPTEPYPSVNSTENFRERWKMQ
jgi:hypothetical protein